MPSNPSLGVIVGRATAGTPAQAAGRGFDNASAISG
jgi:hypothetical protein